MGSQFRVTKPSTAHPTISRLRGGSLSVVTKRVEAIAIDATSKHGKTSARLAKQDRPANSMQSAHRYQQSTFQQVKVKTRHMMSRRGIAQMLLVGVEDFACVQLQACAPPGLHMLEVSAPPGLENVVPSPPMTPSCEVESEKAPAVLL